MTDALVPVTNFQPGFPLVPPALVSLNIWGGNQQMVGLHQSSK